MARTQFSWITWTDLEAEQNLHHFEASNGHHGLPMVSPTVHDKVNLGCPFGFLHDLTFAAKLSG